MTAALVFNNNSGAVRAKKFTHEKLLNALQQHGINASEIDTSDKTQIEQIQSLMPDDILIIAGGDGTIYDALQSSKCISTRVAIIPLGTANNFAISAGIPLDIEDAIETATYGRVKPVDLGRTDSRIFTQVVGVGFHAQAFHEYGEHKYKSSSRAVKAFITALAEWEPQIMRVIADGVTIVENSMQVTVANTPVYGRNIQIAPDAMIDDGMLDVIIFAPLTKMQVIKCMIQIMEGRGIDPSKITHVRARHVVVESVTGAIIPVHADAEPIGFAPVTVEVLPSCLRLMVPK